MEQREQMAKVAHYMWDRRLTNAAGGNFAVLAEENRVLISPSLMSERHFCEMRPEDFLLIDYDMNVLEGTGKDVYKRQALCLPTSRCCSWTAWS